MRSTLSRTSLALLVGLVLAASLPAAAQSQPDVDGSGTLDCASGLALISQLNAFELWDAAAACGDEDRVEDLNYLFALGQLRALADITILKPVDRANEQVMEISTALYYGYSGAVGVQEFFRDAEAAAALEARIRATNLRLTDDYDPGWPYRATSKMGLYEEVIDDTREYLLWERNNVTLLMQDDAYFTAYMERAAFDERTGNGQSDTDEDTDSLIAFGPGIAPGTPEYDEYMEIRARLDAAYENVSQLPPPPENADLQARLREPEPEIAAMQLAVGFNGPEENGTMVLRSADELSQSWLADALSPLEIESVLARTDFVHQVLVVLGFGRRSNASGTIILSDLFFQELFPGMGGYWIDAQIGVVPESCGVPLADSYPFVVAVTEAVADTPDAGPDLGWPYEAGYSTANFGDGCRSIVDGVAVALPQ